MSAIPREISNLIGIAGHNAYANYMANPGGYFPGQYSGAAFQAANAIPMDMMGPFPAANPNPLTSIPYLGTSFPAAVNASQQPPATTAPVFRQPAGTGQQPNPSINSRLMGLMGVRPDPGGFQAANAATQARFAQAYGLLGQLGQAGQADVAQRYRMGASDARAHLQARGLGSSTIMATALEPYTRGAAVESQRVREGVAQQKVGLLSSVDDRPLGDYQSLYHNNLMAGYNSVR